MNRLERLGLEMAEHVEDSAIGGEGGGESRICVFSEGVHLTTEIELKHENTNVVAEATIVVINSSL